VNSRYEFSLRPLYTCWQNMTKWDVRQLWRYRVYFFIGLLVLQQLYTTTECRTLWKSVRKMQKEYVQTNQSDREQFAKKNNWKLFLKYLNFQMNLQLALTVSDSWLPLILYFICRSLQNGLNHWWDHGGCRGIATFGVSSTS